MPYTVTGPYSQLSNFFVWKFTVSIWQHGLHFNIRSLNVVRKFAERHQSAWTIFDWTSKQVRLHWDPGLGRVHQNSTEGGASRHRAPRTVYLCRVGVGRATSVSWHCSNCLPIIQTWVIVEPLYEGRTGTLRSVPCRAAVLWCFTNQVWWRSIFELVKRTLTAGFRVPSCMQDYTQPSSTFMTLATPTQLIKQC